MIWVIFFLTTTKFYNLIIMSFPGAIVTELARYIHLDLCSGEVGGRGGGVNFYFIALFHVSEHVGYFKAIKNFC